MTYGRAGKEENRGEVERRKGEIANIGKREKGGEKFIDNPACRKH